MALLQVQTVVPLPPFHPAVGSSGRKSITPPNNAPVNFVVDGAGLQGRQSHDGLNVDPGAPVAPEWRG